MNRLAETRDAAGKGGRPGAPHSLALALLAVAVFAGAAPAAVVTEIHYTMGTYFSIRVDGMSEKTARAAMRQCFAETRRLEAVFSRYRPDSELSRLNAGASDELQSLSPDMAELLRRSLALRQVTGGAFDTTIGAETALWRDSESWPAPDAVRRRAAGAAPRLRLDGRRLRRLAPGVQLDFDGVAKGYAVDHCVALLRAAGVRRALLDLGESSQYALGAPEGGDGWPLVVRGTDPGQTIGSLRLRDQALSVSAVYGHSRELAGHRVGHIVDPRSGRPLRANALALVVTDDATAAEAHSKAVLIWCGAPGGAAAAACRRERRATAAGLYVEDGRVSAWNAAAMHLRRYPQARAIPAAAEPIR